MADLSKIPLVALSADTKTVVSTLLNPTKWLLTEDGLPRDWRGLAHLCNVGGETIPALAAHSDPVGQLLRNMQDISPCPTIKDLESMLSKIDRWDVIDDTQLLLERDAEQYLRRMERCETPGNGIQAELENKILTMDDLYRVKQGMNNQCYDAFVLYADEDSEFVKEMIDVLENKHRLKLCIKDRDLMGGIPFEHAAVMQLISERCNRLIVVVSPDFLKSSANAFFLNYAQAVGIETGQRKIIPCLYKKCQLPPQLTYQFILDYSRHGLYDFWGRLHACVEVITEDACARSPLPTQQTPKLSNNEEPAEIGNQDYSNLSSNNVANGVTTIGSLKKINAVTCPPVTDKIHNKQVKTKKFVPWLKKKRAKNSLNSETDIEPVTETISITVSLPSLNDLSSLDSREQPESVKPTKRRKNVVGTCVKRVQALLSKQ